MYLSTVHAVKEKMVPDEYCRNASEFTARYGGKTWKYILIPHNAIMVNMSFDTLARQYAVQLPVKV